MTDPVRTITASAVADAIFSADGSSLYAASGSTITAYSVSIGASLATWTVASPISGIALTPDGGHLLAAARDPVLDPGGTATNYTESQFLYSINLSTGTTATFTNHVAGPSAGFFDVASLTNNLAVLSSGGAYNYGAALQYLDLSTGTFTASGTTPNGIPVLDSSSTGQSTLVYTLTPNGYGDFSLYALNSAGAVTATNLSPPLPSSTGIPAFGFGGNQPNTGYMAISDSVGLAAVGPQVFNSSLQLVKDLTVDYPELTSIVGDTFSRSGDKLYILDSRSFSIFEFSTSDWSLLHNYTIGYFTDSYSQSTSYNIAAHGDRLGISPDGHTLSVVTADGIKLVDLSTATGANGTAGNDDLTATDHYQALYGFDGNDTLRSGTYISTVLVGGSGNDTYYANGVTTNIVENPGEGTDSLYIDTSRTDGTYYYYSLPDNVENGTLIQATGGWLSGNAADNKLTGTVGDDILYGLDGNDILEGKAGNDTLYGTNGDDIAVIASTRAATTIGFDAQGNLILSGPDGRDTLSSIETIRFTDQDVAVSSLEITGTTGNDTLVGTANNDGIFGLAGNDTLQGGGGADTLVGGSGDDTYIIGLGDSPLTTVVELPNDGNDTVITSIAFTLPANVETMRLAAGANAILTGNANGGTLIGNELDNDLRAVSGTTRLIGGAGNDNLYGTTAGITIAVINDTIGNSTIGAPAPLYHGGYSYPGNEGTVTSSDGFDTLSGVSRIEFTDGTVYLANLSAIDQTFLTVFGRHPTTTEYAIVSAGLQTQTSIDQVRASIVNGPLAHALDDEQINAAYQNYAGRAPIGNELQVWEGVLQSNGHDYAVVRNAILSDPLGLNYTAQTITQTYQTYAGRAPTSAEVAIWQGSFRSGGTVAALQQAIVRSAEGQAHTAVVVTAIYQTYYGRPPTYDEIGAAGSVLYNGSDIDAVRAYVLDIPAIHTYEVAQITAAYQTYGGRAPTSDEITAWDGALHAGATYTTIRDAILANPIGHYYVDQQITAAYQTYGGRAPTSAEIAGWEGVIGGSQNYDLVKNAILANPIGHYYVDQQITAAYQTYGGRAPTSAEIAGWEGVIGGSQNYDLVKNAILSTPLGHYYVDQQIMSAYVTYGGRVPTVAEFAGWEGVIGGSQNYGLVKAAILGSSLGQPYVDGQITAAYQTYGGRAPIGNELQVWENVLNGNDHNFGVVRDAILNSSLGQPYVDAQITAAYQTYLGRAPSTGETQAWEGALNGNNHDFSVVRNAILSTNVGDTYASTQITALYQRYFLRPPTSDELAGWHGVIDGGKDFDQLRDVLMSDNGSAATTQQLNATLAADTFHFAGTPYLTITGFDPAHDVIDVQGLGFTGVNPLDATHAHQIHAIDGTPDVFITLDATHEILLHNMTLTQLSSADFLL